jgi:putative hydrolase of HD superfamily
MDDLRPVANFLFEIGILNHTPRSGYNFIGAGRQSVAEHIHRVIYCGYALSKLAGDNVNADTVIRMCLFHDITESRISDLNYVHQQYVERNEEKALHDITRDLPFGSEISGSVEEYEKRESMEAQIAKDADQLELLLTLKEQIDEGNAKAASWVKSIMKRFKTEVARKLAEQILETDSDAWWFTDKDGEWWNNRSEAPKV